MRAIVRRIVPIVAVSVLALLLGAAREAMHSARPRTMYTVGAVQAGLVRRPAVWVGRIVQLRGLAISSYCVRWPTPADTPCPGWQHVIADSCIIASPCAVTVLPAVEGPPHPLLAVLHRLPLAGSLVPVAPPVAWGVVGTYSVQLRTAAPDVCPAPPCYEAVLLAAVP